MKRITIYTYLKNTDLHCLSAFEVMKDTMGDAAPEQLKRFVVWDLDFQVDDSRCQAQLDLILNKSYRILNPNKHAYYQGGLPEDTLSPEYARFHVKIEKQYDQDEAAICAQMNRQLGTKLCGLSTYVVYSMVVAKNGLSRGALEDNIRITLLDSRSIQQGFLVNPLFEIASFISVPSTVVAASSD